MEQPTLNFPAPPTEKHFWRVKTHVWDCSIGVQLRRRIGPISIAVTTRYVLAFSNRAFVEEVYRAADSILAKRRSSRCDQRDERYARGMEQFQRIGAFKRFDGDYQ